MKLGFLASHGGSAARHLVAACRTGTLDAVPVALVAGLSRAVFLGAGAATIAAGLTAGPVPMTAALVSVRP